MRSVIFWDSDCVARRMIFKILFYHLEFLNGWMNNRLITGYICRMFNNKGNGLDAAAKLLAEEETKVIANDIA